MNPKNLCALTPPMGWNSWDCFGNAVNEEQLLQNALYMKEHLLAYGWEYVVCDIQWSEPSADFWDDWKLLLQMFERCEVRAQLPPHGAAVFKLA